MPLEWNKDHETNIPKIDDQHKQLIELINSLYQAIYGSETKGKLSEILKGLIEFADVHFKTEEDLFKKYKFPEAKEHITEHQSFKEKMLDIQKKYKKQEIEVSFELVDFLEDWLIDHLETMDQKYVKYFKKLDNFNG